MRIMLRMTGRLLVGLAWIYCVVIVVMALLWLAGIQGIWWLDLANVFALCLFASRNLEAANRSTLMLQQKRERVSSTGVRGNIWRGISGLSVTVPIYRLLERSGFDPEHASAMGKAFEEALVELGLKLCALVAMKIIELGQRGERDPRWLCDQALRDLRGE